MSKLIRNTADETSIAFWASVQQSAEAVRTAPTWMKAGIDLNEANFTTFGPPPQGLDVASVVAKTRR